MAAFIHLCFFALFVCLFAGHLLEPLGTTLQVWQLGRLSFEVPDVNPTAGQACDNLT